MKDSNDNARIHGYLAASVVMVGVVFLIASISTLSSSEATDGAITSAVGPLESTIGEAMTINATTEPLLAPPIDRRQIGEVQTATFALG